MTGVWVTNDTISSTRMNEKTLFQGTGAEIAALGTTYAGMLAFCNSTGSGFTKDVLYERNTADTAWNPIGLDQLPYLKLSTTIGDYTAPNAAVASSVATFLDAVWGKDSDQTTEDFTTYANTTEGDAGWPTSNTAKARVNPTTDVIDIVGTLTASANSIVRDLTSVSDSAWVIRFKVIFSTLTASANNIIWFGMSSASQASGIGSAQDFLGFRFFYSAGTKAYGTIDADGISPDVLPDNAQAWTPSTSTAYYVEMKRTSTTTYSVEIFTGSDYSTGSIGLVTGTCASTVASLRYFKFMGYEAVSEAGVQACTIDDIQIADGRTTMQELASNIYDDNVATQWRSNSEASPSIYVDLSGSAREVVAVALHIDMTQTTVTAIKIRGSTDTSFADAENVAYVNISDFTDDTWRYLAINFLAANVRYIQVIGVGTGVLAINEIKVRYGVSDLLKILNHRHRTRTVDSADAFVDSN